MWRSNQPVHCSNRDLRLERHISESATLRTKWARAHLVREIRTLRSVGAGGSAPGDPVGVETELRRGYLGTARRKRRQQTTRT